MELNQEQIVQFHLLCCLFDPSDSSEFDCSDFSEFDRLYIPNFTYLTGTYNFDLQIDDILWSIYNHVLPRFYIGYKSFTHKAKSVFYIKVKAR